MYNEKYKMNSGGDSVIKTAFAGFEHPHITGLYNDIKKNPLFEISGAFEPDERFRKAAGEKGVEFSNAVSFDEFLNNTDSDVIAVGSHFAARGKIIAAALKAGKHIIADKPLCTKQDELDEIRKIADEKNLAVCILLTLRKSRSIGGAVEAVRNGIAGKINNIIFEGEHPLNYGKRAGWYFENGKHGGTINDIAVHGIDIARMLTFSDVEKVIAAREWNFFAKEVPGFHDSAQFMLKMKNGAGVIADVSYSAPNKHGYSHPSYWHFRIFGEKGMMDFKEGSDDITFYSADGEIRKIPASKPEKNLLDDFADIITDKSKIKEYNREMFASTEQTLMIQKAADCSEH